MSTASVTSRIAPESPASPRWVLVGAFAVIYLVWGSTFLGIKVAVESIPPLTMAAVRFASAGALLMLVSARARPRPTRLEWRNSALVAAFFFLGNHGLVTFAASRLPSGLASLIISTEVALIALFSAVLLPGYRLSGSQLLGMALGLGGVAALFWGADGGAAANPVASAAVLGASASWSLGAVLSQRLRLPGNAVLRAGTQMLSGGAMLAVASVVRGEPFALDVGAISTRSLVALAYLVAFGSILAFAAYVYLLKHVRADAVATHVFVNPLVAVGLGAGLAGEQLQRQHLIAGTLILVSVGVVLLGQRRHG